MPTSTNVTNLKINELTEAQYDTAVSGGVIGANELSIITDLDEAIQVSTMPTASATELGKVYQFIGTTDANYTHGYFYECVSDGLQPATYSWSNVQVQASSGGLPSQTGNAGKFLTTDGTDASWGKLVPQTFDTSSRWIAFGEDTSYVQKIGAIRIGFLGAYAYNENLGQYSTSIGDGSHATGQYGVAIGGVSKASAQHATVIGGYSNTASATYAIQLGGNYKTNSDANTFKVGNENGNFEIMSADGTIPTDRFTTTPSSDGTYYPTLTISSGTPTRSWGTISALQNTATGTNSISVGGAAVSQANATALGIYSGSNAQPYTVNIGYSAYSRGQNGIAIGSNAVVAVNATYAIQLGQGTNSNANTFSVGLSASNNYELLSSDGTIPADRFASTTGLTDGNYRLRLTMSNGTPTLSWVAE